MTIAEEKNSIQALVSDRLDGAFDIGVGLRCSIGSADPSNADRPPYALVELGAKLVVAIMDEKLGRRMVPSGLEDLAVGPLGGGILRCAPG